MIKSPTRHIGDHENMIIVNDEIMQRLRPFFVGVGESYSEILGRILDAVDLDKYDSLITPVPDDLED